MAGGAMAFVENLCAAGVARGVGALRRVGYSDIEIAHMYSVLKRKMVNSVDELLAMGAK